MFRRWSHCHHHCLHSWCVYNIRSVTPQAFCHCQCQLLLSAASFVSYSSFTASQLHKSGATFVHITMVNSATVCWLMNWDDRWSPVCRELCPTVYRLTTFGGHLFTCIAPSIWNSARCLLCVSANFSGWVSLTTSNIDYYYLFIYLS